MSKTKIEVVTVLPGTFFVVMNNGMKNTISYLPLYKVLWEEQMGGEFTVVKNFMRNKKLKVLRKILRGRIHLGKIWHLSEFMPSITRMTLTKTWMDQRSKMQVGIFCYI